MWTVEFGGKPCIFSARTAILDDISSIVSVFWMHLECSCVEKLYLTKQVLFRYNLSDQLSGRFWRHQVLRFCFWGDCHAVPAWSSGPACDSGPKFLFQLYPRLRLEKIHVRGPLVFPQRSSRFCHVSSNGSNGLKWISISGSKGEDVVSTIQSLSKELTSEPHNPVAITFTRTCLEEGSLGISRFSYWNFPICSSTSALFCLDLIRLGQNVTVWDVYL